MLTCCGRLDGASSNMYGNPVHIGRSPRMPRHATYTYVREHLARLLEQVEADRDVVIINRRGHEAVALVPAGELESLVETAHLMRSPRNAERLLAALRREEALRVPGRAHQVRGLHEALQFARRHERHGFVPAAIDDDHVPIGLHLLEQPREVLPNVGVGGVTRHAGAPTNMDRITVHVGGCPVKPAAAREHGKRYRPAVNATSTPALVPPSPQCGPHPPVPLSAMRRGGTQPS